MDESAQNQPQIRLQDQNAAMDFIDKMLQKQRVEMSSTDTSVMLGAEIISEQVHNGQKVWEYIVHGLPQQEGGARMLLVENGKIITIPKNNNNDSIEKEVSNTGVSEEVREKAARLLGVNPDQLKLLNYKDVGTRFSEEIRGGALFIGSDGSLLYSNSTVLPLNHIKAYLQGQRTPEDAFYKTN